jgi:hypothetical protein
MALRQPVTTELTPDQACTAGQQNVHELILARSFIGCTGLFLKKFPFLRAAGFIKNRLGWPGKRTKTYTNKLICTDIGGIVVCAADWANRD